MTYFRVLSIVLGGWMVAGGLWVLFFTETWKKLILRMCPEKRPSWLLVANLFFVGFLVWTWYWFLKHMSVYSFVITFALSLSLVKMVPAIFCYGKFREIILGLVSESVALRIVVGSSAAIGLALLMMGLFF